MAEALSTGMDKDEMRTLLRKASPTNPISFAFAADKKQPAVAILVMHKSKDPKGCARLLEAEFKDNFNLRFGTVTVDPEEPKKAIFKVNKSVSGFAKRLSKTLKGTGFSFIDIVLEDGSSVESDSDADAAEAVAPGVPTPSGPPSGPTPGGPTPDAAASVPPPPAGPKPGNPAQAHDPAALTKELGELARQIKAVAGSDTALLGKLMKFATDANVNIKTNNLTYAAMAIAQLKTAIAAAPVAKAPAAPDQDEDKGIDPALQREWDGIWASADPKVAAAIKVDGADAGKLRAVRDYMLGKAETGDFQAAKKSLITLLGLIGAAPKPKAAAEAPAAPIKDEPAADAKAPAAPIKDAPVADAEAPAAPMKEVPVAEAPATGAPATDSTDTTTGTGRAKGAAVRLAQAMIVWNDARSHVKEQIKLLQQEIIAQTADEPDADEIKASLGNLEEILENLDDSLTAKLGDLRGTTDPDKKAALSDQARAAVRKMQDYAKSDELMNEIDNDNGFVKLSIQSRVTAALAEVLETI